MTARFRRRARCILAQVPPDAKVVSGRLPDAVKYLICDAHFVTGHTINVDGGRSIAL